MTDDVRHATHPDVVLRLKRADGHLRSVIDMIGNGRPCLDVAQQLHAVEKAIAQAKRVFIQDHIDHCLDEAAGSRPDLESFKAITRYL